MQNSKRNCALFVKHCLMYSLKRSRSHFILRAEKVWKALLVTYLVVSEKRRHSVKYNGLHDDVIKWKYFPRYWPFVRGIHRSPVNSPHKGQWRGALIFSLICVWINGWVNNRETGDLRRYRAHYDVILMWTTHKRPILALICEKFVQYLFSTLCRLGFGFDNPDYND